MLDTLGDVFYVGRTKDPHERLKSHRFNHREKIGSMSIVQSVFHNETPAEAEARWIQYYICKGISLINVLHASGKEQKPKASGNLRDYLSRIGSSGGKAAALSMTETARHERAIKAVTAREKKRATKRTAKKAK